MLSHLARRAAVALTFLLVAPGLVACGGEDKSDAPEAEPTSSRPLPKGWVRLTDEPTGVQFALPKKVRPKVTRKSSGDDVLIARSYIVGEDPSVTVQILSFDDGDPLSFDADTVPANVVAGLTAAGSTDARYSGPRKGKLFGVASRDYTIEFTSSAGFEPYWRMKSLQNDKASVFVQVIGDEESPNSHVRVERAMSAVARSIQLSD